MAGASRSSPGKQAGTGSSHAAGSGHEFPSCSSASRCFSPRTRSVTVWTVHTALAAPPRLSRHGCSLLLSRCWAACKDFPVQANLTHRQCTASSQLGFASRSRRLCSSARGQVQTPAAPMDHSIAQDAKLVSTQMYLRQLQTHHAPTVLR